jgi:hydroxymethylpyrimidine kinase/phosphomethylpyrimidine kinase
MSRTVVCSIGTTDPWNASGLGLDLRVLAELGVRPVSVVAAVSAQDENGIGSLTPLEPEAIAAQWASLARADIGAVRIGALVGAAAVRAVAALVGEARVPVVYDPVLRATRGGAFADAAALDAIRTDLLRAVTVCTPNLQEAALLADARVGVTSVEGMRGAARAIRNLGASAVLVTGGHLAGDPSDVLLDAAGEVTYSGARIRGEMRGSGCVLAAALAAELARGVELRDAVTRARAFVSNKIAGAVSAGDMRLAY